MYEERINYDHLTSILNKYEYFFLDEDDIHNLNGFIIEDEYCRTDPPIVYPIKPPILKIKRNESGKMIIEKLLEDGLSISVEIQKCLTNACN